MKAIIRTKLTHYFKNRKFKKVLFQNLSTNFVINNKNKQMTTQCRNQNYSFSKINKINKKKTNTNDI